MLVLFVSAFGCIGKYLFNRKILIISLLSLILFNRSSIMDFACFSMCLYSYVSIYVYMYV